MTKRSSCEAATRRDPLGSAVFSKSRFERYLSSFLVATSRNAGLRGRVPRSAVVMMKSGFDGVEQRLHPERHVLDAAVHEEAGRAAHAAFQPAIDMLTHSLQV